ncbi:uncharacterized protein LOC131803401 [Musca domestica]|uniref:Uncharacterized protein LOC131803401 n=1 Tax=Musca domestica TaxID=7370 RepID=A0A1I8M2T0_MUSDO|nr:uncharacterized protein LOC131803401 [Musca domestica]
MAKSSSSSSSASRRSSILHIIGNIIGYMQIITFTILLICSGHFAFNVDTCPFDSSAYVCLGVFCVMLAMFLLSFILAVAITMRQAAFMLPWLIMSIVVIIGDITYLAVFPNIILGIFSSLVICPLLLSWYPLYKLYGKYNKEKTREEQRLSDALDETHTLNRAAQLTTPPSTLYPNEVVQYYRSLDRRPDSAAYDASLPVDPNFAYISGTPAPGWRIGLYPKMSNKEYV